MNCLAHHSNTAHAVWLGPEKKRVDIPVRKYCKDHATKAAGFSNLQQDWQRDCAGTGEAARAYSGVCDGLGEVASSAEDGGGEVAAGAGYTAPLDIPVECHLLSIAFSFSSCKV
jgi:hypothetical protein